MEPADCSLCVGTPIPPPADKQEVPSETWPSVTLSSLVTTVP